MSNLNNVIKQVQQAIDIDILRFPTGSVPIGEINSVSKMLENSSGISLINTIQLNEIGTVTKNIFRFKGTLRIFSIGFLVLDVVSNTSASNVYFDINDGVVSTPITKVTGANLTGITTNSFAIKTEVSGNAINIINADQVRILEGSGIKVLQDTILNGKNGEAWNNIRFSYTGSDNFDIMAIFYLAYQRLGFGEVEPYIE